MSKHTFITGLGLITPLGASVEQTWRGLLEGHFIRDHARVPSLEGRELRVEPARKPRVVCLARSAAREALSQARWGDQHLRDPQTAMIVGTSKGPIETWITAPPGHAIGRCVSGLNSCYGLADLCSQLAEEIGLSAGPRATLSGACASGIHALIHASLLLRSGAARRALVVAAEASVHPLFVGSFRRLGVLAAEGIGCRPFDESRDGFLMSEAAAAVCLDSSPGHAQGIRVDRMALGADATHLTGSHPGGEPLRRLLARVVDGRPIDLIHAHATGTVLSDPIELSAIEAVVGEANPHPSVWSHKGALGHSLARPDWCQWC